MVPVENKNTSLINNEHYEGIPGKFVNEMINFEMQQIDEFLRKQIG